MEKTFTKTEVSDMFYDLFATMDGPIFENQMLAASKQIMETEKLPKSINDIDVDKYLE